MVGADTEHVALPAVVDLDALDAVRDQLIEAIERGPVLVSGSAVERISTNALFMLISAAESARRNNFSFTLARASNPLATAIERLGLGDRFAGMMKG